MKPLKCPWRLFAKIFLIPAGIFLILLLVAFLIDTNTYINIDHRAVYLNFIIQTLIWCAISLFFFVLSHKTAAKLKRLKYGGIEYNGKVEDIIPLYGVRALHNVTFKADCSYVNKDGKTCLVRSAAVLMSVIEGRENITAKIYVNRNEPKDYAVELFRLDAGGIKADYDYRK